MESRSLCTSCATRSKAEFTSLVITPLTGFFYRSAPPEFKSFQRMNLKVGIREDPGGSSDPGISEGKSSRAPKPTGTTGSKEIHRLPLTQWDTPLTKGIDPEARSSAATAATASMATGTPVTTGSTGLGAPRCVILICRV